MSAWAKQKQTEPAHSIGKPRLVEAGDARRKWLARQPVSFTPDHYSAPVDWRDEQQVRLKVSEWTASRA